ncbi:MAG: phosphatase PAP2 family protein [Nitrospira sp.]|nr:phosphatase PAP2 family protein [Nitrospira sp.]
MSPGPTPCRPISWPGGVPFPSDHASTSSFPLPPASGWCPAVGAFAFLHAAVIVSIPRIYVGLHFPTDILSGACLGVTAVAVIWKWRAVFVKLVEPALAWSKTSPHLFYPAFFILTSELAHLFKDSRWLAESLWHMAKLSLAR